MRPVIGITTHISDDERTLQNNRTYSDALLAVGALPLLLPATTDANVIGQYADLIDGLLLSGGVDVDPTLFGENQKWACGGVNTLRDDFEMKLIKSMLRHPDKPILGICRGIQILNVALGGDLYQDLQSSFETETICHRQKQRAVYCSHSVEVRPGSKLHAIYGEERIMVNSLHHQAVRKLPEGVLPSAVAPDSVVEAVELQGHPFCLGVQWHPEVIWDEPGGEIHAKLFSAFVDACKARN